MKMLARSVLVMEIFIMGFALLLAKDLPGSDGLVFGGVIALLAFVAAGTLKKRTGWILGWLVQILMIAYGFVVFSMFFLGDRKSTRLNSSHVSESRMPSSA